MSKNNVALAEFNDTHLELLSDWLERDHVRPWYPNPDEDLENARTLCAEPSDAERDAGQFLILVDGRPAGYLRWQLVPEAVLNEIGLTGVPGNSADVDLLIGKRSLICKGLGARVLASIEERLRMLGDVPAVGLTTSKENRFAHRAFEKSGYAIAGEYSPDGYGSCFLYLKHL